jgi:DNA-binding CsgD family transcriptional regulator
MMSQKFLLTDREVEVVQLLLQGKSNKMIALKLGISISTVEFHLTNIYMKMNVGSKFELILNLVDKVLQQGKWNLGKSPDDKQRDLSDNDLGKTLVTNGANLKAKEMYSMQNKIGRNELTLKTNIIAGTAASLISGIGVVLLMMRFGHTAFESVLPWILPLTIVLTGLGAFLGWLNHKRSYSLWKLIITTMVGVYTGAILMIPIVGFVVYPLTKVIMRWGIIQRELIPNETASSMVIVAYLIAWLVSGLGISFFFNTIITKRKSVLA